MKQDQGATAPAAALRLCEGHTTTGYVPLSELQRDALIELVNTGAGTAAARLRKMVGEQVLLSVPSVEVVSHKSAVTLIG